MASVICGVGRPREQRPFPSSRTGALAPGTVRYRARELFGCAKREIDSNNRSRQRAVSEALWLLLFVEWGDQGNRGHFRPREQALSRREQCAIAHGNFLATPKGKLIQTTARESELFPSEALFPARTCLFPKPTGFCYLFPIT